MLVLASTPFSRWNNKCYLCVCACGVNENQAAMKDVIPYSFESDLEIYVRCVIIFKVKYDATNFLEKNRDTLSPDIIQVLRSSGKESALMNEQTKKRNKGNDLKGNEKRFRTILTWRPAWTVCLTRSNNSCVENCFGVRNSLNWLSSFFLTDNRLVRTLMQHPLARSGLLL